MTRIIAVMNTADHLPKPLTEMAGMLGHFHPVTLTEMDSVRLLNRLDTKFTFNRALLSGILEEMGKDYSILDIDGRRISRYETDYLDTDNHQFYFHHHNGKRNRYKVRFRKYVDTGDTFFEVKRKTNKGRMIKERIMVPGVDSVISGNAAAFLRERMPLDPATLKPALTVFYSRMTFVGHASPERITIDTDLSYRHGSREIAFPHLVIAESKQLKSAHSPFAAIMHLHHIRSISISKYCLGIASLHDQIKSNNFKNRIHYINLINNDTH